MSDISNVTIEEFINEENGDLKKNFVGLFPSHFIMYFKAFQQLIKEKSVFILIEVIKKVLIGGVFLSFITEKHCFYLIVLVLKD